MKSFTSSPFIWIRSGLAFVFGYAGIASFLDPTSWIGYLPKFFTSLFPASQMLTFFSIYELILFIWLLTGYKLRISAFLSVLTFSGIIVFNLGAMDIIFRDVGLLFCAVALSIGAKS